MRYEKPILILILISALFYGCAHKPGAPEPSAQELFQEAQSLAKSGRVDKAAEAYMKVRTYYPGHELAKESLITLGDLYYEHEEYESALGSYQEFRLLYPTDPKAAYGLFQIGMCHFKQVLSFDRDQTETFSAARTFSDFLKLYPDSPYRLEAEERLREARILLAKNNLYIGKFYLKKHNREAACKRFQFVKDNFAGLGLDDEVNKLAAQSCKP